MEEVITDFGDIFANFNAQSFFNDIFESIFDIGNINEFAGISGLNGINQINEIYKFSNQNNMNCQLMNFEQCGTCILTESVSQSFVNGQNVTTKTTQTNGKTVTKIYRNNELIQTNINGQEQQIPSQQINLELNNNNNNYHINDSPISLLSDESSTSSHLNIYDLNENNNNNTSNNININSIHSNTINSNNNNNNNNDNNRLNSCQQPFVHSNVLDNLHVGSVNLVQSSQTNRQTQFNGNVSQIVNNGVNNIHSINNVNNIVNYINNMNNNINNNIINKNKILHQQLIEQQYQFNNNIINMNNLFNVNNNMNNITITNQPITMSTI